MSFFFGGNKKSNNIPSPDVVDEQRVMMMVQAKMEIDGLSVFFNKMADTCFAKCVSNKHHDGSLAVSEMTCIDRCIVKYMETQTEVGKFLQSVEQEQQAMQLIAGKK